MSRTTSVAVVVIALVIIATGALAYLHGSPENSLSYAVIENGDRQHREDTQYYTIQVNYPATTSLATRGSWGAESRAENTIAATLNDFISQFKDTADSISQDEKDRLTAANIKYSLDVGYHAYSSGSFVSYEFDVFTDTGGAHPISSYKTLVFDMNGATVSLADLFTPGSDYLDRISQAAQQQVAAQLDMQGGDGADQSMISDGVAPKAENFENFVVDSDRIRIFIPPYQAAAYAAGSFEVQIPLVDVKDILKPGIN
ncbi:MAG TPA: DUF3298 domain-containing protein [Candidatus Paceibacterota bacterium]|nr:DUF3298 domain-containing protein [Candidatus Paceibacterota bacterium]